jgi:D-alanyl-D-alanine dipeptidase
MLRKGLAEKLALINNSLNHPAIEAVFNGAVELYIQDALRPVPLQAHLHDVAFPALLRRNHPGMTDEEVAKRVNEIIAVGSADPLKPSPHATGGVVDIVLRYVHERIGWAPDALVDMGHSEGETSQRINPEYFEWQEPVSTEDATARRHRRAYNAIMTGAAFGISTGLVVNPTEFWHWGEGDQLSTLVAGREKAFYSIPPAA